MINFKKILVLLCIFLLSAVFVSGTSFCDVEGQVWYDDGTSVGSGVNVLVNITSGPFKGVSKEANTGSGPPWCNGCDNYYFTSYVGDIECIGGEQLRNSANVDESSGYVDNNSVGDNVITMDIYLPKPDEPSTPGGGGGSQCTERWYCTPWSECKITRLQERKCERTKICPENPSEKPKELQRCDYDLPTPKERVGDLNLQCDINGYLKFQNGNTGPEGVPVNITINDVTISTVSVKGPPNEFLSGHFFVSYGSSFCEEGNEMYVLAEDENLFGDATYVFDRYLGDGQYNVTVELKPDAAKREQQALRDVLRAEAELLEPTYYLSNQFILWLVLIFVIFVLILTSIFLHSNEKNKKEKKRVRRLKTR